MSGRRETPSQTAGPYVHIGLTPRVAGLTGVFAHDVGDGPPLGADAPGVPITVEGRVIDGTGAPVRDACVEFWQADAAGRYHSAAPAPASVPHGRGFARVAVDPQDGLFAIRTIKPGRVALTDGRLQAPHIAVVIFARGINIGLHTRLYFDDEALANASDPVLSRIDPPHRTATLIAARDGGVFRHDIILQGAHETVFFDV